MTSIEPIPAPPDVSAPPPNAERTASGLAFKVLRASTSTGPAPQLSDSVTVHYTGWTADGNMFESSVAPNAPATFALEGLIPGWREGLQLMRPGEKRRFWIPEELAYKGAADSPKGMLVFDVELLDILAAKKRIAPPRVLTRPPANAITTSSGLVYEIVETKGDQKHPGANALVQVDYTGWTSDGAVFDTTRDRGRAELPLARLMPGWREGLQLMAPGDAYRFWIPQHLAFDGRPGAPAGTLVFEVRLHGFRDQK
jgi:peptidylprolyl isomerase